jgi:D-3-phosphoglycerate dehydrogenase
MPEVTIAVLDQFHPLVIKAIEQALPRDWTARFAPEGTVPSRAEVLRDAEVAFVMAAPVPRELLESARRLRFIQKMGAGVDRIDLDTCRRRGIAVARLHAGNSIPVAEHTVLLMLAAYRRLPLIDRLTRAGAWSKEEARGVHRQLYGKTIGLVGFGAIGRAVAKILRGFEAKIVYYDPIRAPREVEDELAAQYRDLDDLIRTADIVSLHLPLLPETAGLIDAARIFAMKPGAVLINCARGGLVDEEALAKALREGHLFAAGLDAFAKEPPSGSPLLELDNTVVSSHLAGATLDNFANVIDRAVTNTKAVLRGERLPASDIVV